jgi:hypothetical protein
MRSELDPKGVEKRAVLSAADFRDARVLARLRGTGKATAGAEPLQESRRRVSGATGR